MYYITINVQYVRYSTGRKIKYFIVLSFNLLDLKVLLVLSSEAHMKKPLMTLKTLRKPPMKARPL